MVPSGFFSLVILPLVLLLGAAVEPARSRSTTSSTRGSGLCAWPRSAIGCSVSASVWLPASSPCPWGAFNQRSSRPR